MKKILIFAVLAVLLVGVPFVVKLTRGTAAKAAQLNPIDALRYE